MTPLERIRLATALAHTVPGATLRFDTGDGNTVTVGRHPSADIDSCALRHVIAAGCRSNHDERFGRHFEVIDRLHLGGTLNDLGGGVFASLIGGHHQRWVATLVTHDRVATLLDGVDARSGGGSVLRACVRPDTALGVTVLSVLADVPTDAEQLDAIATSAAALCFVDELTASAGAMVPANELAGGMS